MDSNGRLRYTKPDGSIFVGDSFGKLGTLNIGEPASKLKTSMAKKKRLKRGRKMTEEA